jgi:hypothetical protein
VPSAAGLWWIHALLLATAVWLIAKRQGWLLAGPARRRSPAAT